MQREHLRRPEPALVAEELGQIPDAGSCLAIAGAVSEHPRVTTRRPGEPEQELDGGRLPTAVGTEEPEHLAARDHHGQPGERDLIAVVLGELERPHGGLLGLGCHQCIERAIPSAVSEEIVPATAYTT